MSVIEFPNASQRRAKRSGSYTRRSTGATFARSAFAAVT